MARAFTFCVAFLFFAADTPFAKYKAGTAARAAAKAEEARVAAEEAKEAKARAAEKAKARATKESCMWCGRSQHFLFSGRFPLPQPPATQPPAHTSHVFPSLALHPVSTAKKRRRDRDSDDDSGSGSDGSSSDGSSDAGRSKGKKAKPGGGGGGSGAGGSGSKAGAEEPARYNPVKGASGVVWDPAWKYQVGKWEASGTLKKGEVTSVLVEEGEDGQQYTQDFKDFVEPPAAEPSPELNCQYRTWYHYTRVITDYFRSEKTPLSAKMQEVKELALAVSARLSKAKCPWLYPAPAPASAKK